MHWVTFNLIYKQEKMERTRHFHVFYEHEKQQKKLEIFMSLMSLENNKRNGLEMVLNAPVRAHVKFPLQEHMLPKFHFIHLSRLLVTNSWME